MPHEIVYKNIKLLRHLYGYSQQYVSDFLHVSKASYCAIETGKKSPDWSHLCLLARLYGVDSNQLISVDITDQILIALHTDHRDMHPLHFAERYFYLSPSARDLVRAQILTLYERERG